MHARTNANKIDSMKTHGISYICFRDFGCTRAHECECQAIDKDAEECGQTQLIAVYLLE